MSKIKFAVIGAGHIGKRHAEMIKREEEAELVAMVDIRSQEECGAQDFDVPFFTTIEELLNSGIEFDVANVCTPNGFHASQSLQILDAKRHVVCEKPMALSKKECEEVIFKSLQVSKQVFCVMQNRYSPPSAWIKDLIEQKILGDIFIVQLNCYWNRDERYYKPGGWKGKQDLDGGTLFTQFSHFIDIMYWLFGDIKNIQGKFADFTHKDTTDFEDSGIVNFDFINGGMGCINYSTSVAMQNLESSITIIGSNGSVKIGGQYMNEVEICNINGYEMPELAPTNPGNDYGQYKGSAANHNYVIQNVIDTLKGRNSATTNALEGLKVVEIIERIYDVRNESNLR
ncbi:Gfo/Idh/MocA family oxidoreductase [Crocinitomicaceae bacterium CZZ-1]|uniref:Gfo/Idh/MocA family oxidoreductase n=1 Tax=Taishania pollutisoli TaxID=2766479 RepID=A0A8J6PK12_9FLAO|nr:Gfo/Idh/MocA family oxidoreductase [Taishania pollutisoli]MBC9812944.1 Gfo/Idh/MocA family oxidoreductase [Taishania pollutisoli]MBX2949616.1 Gfo/Idh/MocA family oxidoreductase [Crocinitomicaceae bacterium]NGF76894.1 Gfo/Idh/MocA family oxidoreductase [Fluviicola sp. SGL-29]